MKTPTTARWLVIAAGLLATGIAAGLLGCRSNQLPVSTAPATSEDLPILWQASGTYSRLKHPVRLVVRDTAMLSQIPLCQIPVDFKTQMVLVAGLGPTSRNDLGLTIQRVWREGSRIRVLERQIYPGAEPATGLHPASPWIVVVVPRSDLNVENYSSEVPKGLFGHPPRPR